MSANVLPVRPRRRPGHIWKTVSKVNNFDRSNILYVLFWGITVSRVDGCFLFLLSIQIVLIKLHYYFIIIIITIITGVSVALSRNYIYPNVLLELTGKL